MMQPRAIPTIVLVLCCLVCGSASATAAETARTVWPIPALTAPSPTEAPRAEQANTPPAPTTTGKAATPGKQVDKTDKQPSQPPATTPVKTPGTTQDTAQDRAQPTAQDRQAQDRQAQDRQAQDRAAPAATAATSPLSPAREAAAAYAKGDYAKAHELWRTLAAAGDAGAMNGLGLLHDRGQGVEPDAGRALHWFARAAEAGDVAGMSNYGRMLEQGRGTLPDPAGAARWLDLAARRGSPEAQYNLGLLYEHGRGVPQDDKAAAAWYSRAAAAGEGAALSRLGQFYRLGRGVPQDTARATLLLHAAAMQGQADAIRALEELAQQGPARSAAVLFGQRLDDTDRQTMREVLHKASVPVKRASDDFVCDVYDVRAAIPGANEMALCYAAGKAAPLGFVKLDYPARDAATAQRILQMVEARFGQPSAGEGDNARLWNLGSAVVATQHLPEHGLMSLMYMIPRVYHQTQRPGEDRP